MIDPPFPSVLPQPSLSLSHMPQGLHTMMLPHVTETCG